MAETRQENDIESRLQERIKNAVDELSLKDLYAIDSYVMYLRDMAHDPVLKAHLDAPFDDEPESEAERTAVDEALEDVRAGRVTPHEEVRKRLLGSPE